MEVVHTTVCPECNRQWTGRFANEAPAKAVCKDCVYELPEARKGHKDLTINPTGR